LSLVKITGMAHFYLGSILSKLYTKLVFENQPIVLMLESLFFRLLICAGEFEMKLQMIIPQQEFATVQTIGKLLCGFDELKSTFFVTIYRQSLFVTRCQSILAHTNLSGFLQLAKLWCLNGEEVKV